MIRPRPTPLPPTWNYIFLLQPLHRLHLFNFVTMSLPMRTHEPDSYNPAGYDGNGGQYRNGGYEHEEDMSKKSDLTPPNIDYDLDRLETNRDGSVFQPVMAQDSSYKVLNRWQASLIYITNQVGIGILSLPTALQTLGLIPGIICIIGMGVLDLYFNCVSYIYLLHIYHFRHYCHIYCICVIAVFPKIPYRFELCRLLQNHRRNSSGCGRWHCLCSKPYFNLQRCHYHHEHRAEQHL